jgi:hypothetical protein
MSDEQETKEGTHRVETHITTKLVEETTVIDYGLPIFLHLGPQPSILFSKGYHLSVEVVSGSLETGEASIVRGLVVKHSLMLLDSIHQHV